MFLRKNQFLQFSNKLSEIECKYFQFLEPEIIESLIKIQQECSGLENITNVAVLMPVFFTAVVDKGIIKKDQLPKNFDKFEIEPMVDAIFLSIIREIEKLRNRGIPIYPEKGKN